MPSPSKEVNDFHERSDVDSSWRAQHHTLGTRANQAAPGNHTHPGIGGGDTSLLPRLTLYNAAEPDAGPIVEGDSGQSNDFTWTVAEELGLGSAYIINDGSSLITITEPGIYAINASIYAQNIFAARLTSSLGVVIYPGWNQSSDYSVHIKGGDVDSGEPTVSFVYYLSQENIDNGDNNVDVTITWTDFDDTHINGTYVDCFIQKIGGAGPKGDTGPAGADGSSEDTSLLPRVTVYKRFNFSDPGVSSGITGDTSNYGDWEWDVITGLSVGVGSTFVISPNNAEIQITQPGIYSVTWLLELDRIRLADPTTVVSLLLNPYSAASAYSLYARGGDADGDNTHTEHTTAFVYYISQEDIDDHNGAVSFDLYWRDLDLDNIGENVYVEAYIQQIGGAAGPQGTTGPAGPTSVDFVTESTDPYPEASPVSGKLYYDNDIQRLFLKKEGSGYTTIGGDVVNFPIEFVVPSSGGTAPEGAYGFGAYQVIGESLVTASGYIQFQDFETPITQGDTTWYFSVPGFQDDFWGYGLRGGFASSWQSIGHGQVIGFGQLSRSGVVEPVTFLGSPYNSDGNGVFIMQLADGTIYDHSQPVLNNNDWINYQLNYMWGYNS